MIRLGITFLACVLTSGGYGNFVPNINGTQLGKVAQVGLATFSQVQVLDLAATDADLKGFAGGFASGGYGYFVPHFNNGAYFGKVARVNLASFSQVQVLDLTATDPDLKGFYGGFASNGYGYFVPYNNFDMSEKIRKIDDAYFGKVVRIDLTQGSLSFMIRLEITILKCVLFRIFSLSHLLIIALNHPTLPRLLPSSLPLCLAPTLVLTVTRVPTITYRQPRRQRRHHHRHRAQLIHSNSGLG